MIKIIFYTFAAILIVAAMRVISAKNPVHAALYLVLAFFSSAALWILLEAEFLAISLVLVYVGAVMVLFLFVVMMLDVNLSSLREGFMHYLPVGITVAAFVLIELLLVVGSAHFGLEVWPKPAPVAADALPNTVALAQVLYQQYVYPFEIAAVILLVAMIAAIALTMRPRRDTKAQDPAQQVKVKRQDRVRLVDMPAEKS